MNIKSYILDTHPELAAEAVDPASLEGVSTFSHKKILWKCERGHVYEMAPAQRTKQGCSCPYCSGRKVLEGFNDLATTHPDMAAQLVHPEIAKTVSAGSKKRVEWRCPDHPDHVWEATVLSRVRPGEGKPRGCPYCAGKKVLPGFNDMATTHPELAAKCADPADATRLSAFSNKTVPWRCPDCGTVFEAKVSSMVLGHAACPECAQRRAHPGKTDLVTTHPDLAAQLVGADPASVTAGSGRLLEWRCPDCGNTWKARPFDRSNGKGSCPYCANKKVLPGFNDLATTRPDLAAQLADPSLATTVTAGSHAVLEWTCEKEHRWLASVYNRSNGTGCPYCNGHLTSTGQDDLADVVRALVPGEEVLVSDRSILPGKLELDVVVPSRRFAVEFNGIVWHSERYSDDPNRHKRKLDAARACGYRLVYVWQDDWETRRDVVVKMLAAKLGADIPDGLLDADDPLANDRAMARKLEPRRVDPKVAAEFLDANHIQGKSRSSRHFGLFDDEGTLRALLSARTAAHNARMNRKDGEWDVQRYATRGHVAGGFSRLLAYAERELASEGTPVRKWISFSANDVSDGGMYAKCGFEPEAELKPDYRYAGNATRWQRRPKEAFQKRRFRENPDLAYDPNMTEHELARLNGLYRCYDSGKKRWVKNVPCPA